MFPKAAVPYVYAAWVAAQFVLSLKLAVDPDPIDLGRSALSLLQSILFVMIASLRYPFLRTFGLSGLAVALMYAFGVPVEFRAVTSGLLLGAGATTALFVYLMLRHRPTVFAIRYAPRNESGGDFILQFHPSEESARSAAELAAVKYRCPVKVMGPGRKTIATYMPPEDKSFTHTTGG